VFIVLKGRVKVSMVSSDGREVILAVLERGGVFGMIEALDGGPRVGTAVSLSGCRLAKIALDPFLRWLAAYPEVQQKLLVGFAQMLRRAYSKVGEQALHPVKRRLYTTLVEIARAEGELRGDGVVFQRPTHQELADRTGSSRVVISRLLKELLVEDDELLAEGKTIRLPLSALVPQEEI
jgi:CRP/FNR family transcriptional regulator, cyclic AMP receptor protein